MASTSQRPKGRDAALSTLDVSIQVLSLAKDTCGIPPAQIALGSAVVLLTMIRDTMANNQDYVDLGRVCGQVCQALDRGVDGRRLDELSRFVLGAIGQLTTTVAEIQMKVAKQGKRNAASRFFHSKSDKDNIAAWKQDLLRVLQVFNTELVINTNIMVADIHRNALTEQEGASAQNRSTQVSIPLGELPPPPPRDCFGRDELIEKVIGFAENLEPFALIGAGGIGKTSIALTALHHDRIIQRFGENRRFIRCDQFPASHNHLLSRISEVIGAGVQNPKDLTPLRPLLSSKEVLIILDNAESILDPKGPDAEKIYSVVDELCRFKKVCLCITSRITTVPPRCRRPEIPPLSKDAACDIFYGIYGDGRRSSIIDDLLERLDFHALSITLLATTAAHNSWSHNRLAKEWDTKRAQVLQADYNKSLAATIELSLGSPTFRSLGPKARDLLGVVAFFPQGINEENLDWLFPTITDRENIFDKFCLLSLTYRSNTFITALAPIRDYLGPRDPQSSPLLCATRDHYLTRLSVNVHPTKPGFAESAWILPEDVNVEHLLDVFTSVDPKNDHISDACRNFFNHLVWNKPRPTLLGSKIEALSDDRPSKPAYLYELARLLGQVGNYTEQKRLLTLTLKLHRRRGDDARVAHTLQDLSGVNRLLGLHQEGMQHAEEALEIYERIDDKFGLMWCLDKLAWLLLGDEKLDAAENAASRAIDICSTVEGGQEFILGDLHRVLGYIHRNRGNEKKAIHQFETALRMITPFNWHNEIFWNRFALAQSFDNGGQFDDAHAQIELAKPHACNDEYKLGRAMQMQADVWYRQRRLEDAKSGALRALQIYERSGAEQDVGLCRELLQKIERAVENRSTRFQA